MNRIELRSADGCDVVSLLLESQGASVPEQHVLLQCFLVGKSYSRLNSLRDLPISDVTLDDYEIKLPQIVSNYEALHQLCDGIRNWMSSRGLFQTTLGRFNEQQFTFSLEVLSDFICSADRPVAIFAYSVHRLALDVRFVVDESCLQEFVDQITQSLKTAIK